MTRSQLDEVLNVQTGVNASKVPLLYTCLGLHQEIRLNLYFKKCIELVVKMSNSVLSLAFPLSGEVCLHSDPDMQQQPFVNVKIPLHRKRLFTKELKKQTKILVDFDVGQNGG